MLRTSGSLLHNSVVRLNHRYIDDDTHTHRNYDDAYDYKCGHKSVTSIQSGHLTANLLSDSQSFLQLAKYKRKFYCIAFR